MLIDLFFSFLRKGFVLYLSYTGFFMKKLKETLSEARKDIDQSFKNLTAAFAEAGSATGHGKPGQAESGLDILYKLLLEYHQQTNKALNRVSAEMEHFENCFAELISEKDQFKALYDSCVMFSSHTELENLIAFAIDQLIAHLKADRGFLILVNERGETEFLISRNFEGETIDQPAKEVSLTVIRQTLDLLKPVRIDDHNVSEHLIRKGSFVRLGLSSVLSVPVVYRKNLLGVIYLDRKEGSPVFQNREQSFLIAFARQVAFRIQELKEIHHTKSRAELHDKTCLQLLRERYHFSEIIGKSEKLTTILELCVKVAPTDATALILGESGVGKELIARALHFNSERSGHPFIAINCGAIPSDLLESELFGYEAGAFTGASKAKPGKFEQAHNGTLFMDEIAELSFNLQSKILRFLQTHECERLGGNRQIKINVRVIAATNKPLFQLVKDKKFREDLYYRLNVVQIEVPSLRERPEDIHLLVDHFIRKYGNGKITGIDDDALSVLEHYRWDGNIRELENVIQRAVILSNTPEINIRDLPPEIVAESEERYKIKTGLTLDEAENDFRKWFIIRTLQKTHNNKAKAAELLGINRSHFFKILNQLNIEI